MEFLQQLLSLLLASSIAMGVVAYVGKLILGQVLARDIENHKSTLAKDYEQFKRTLDAVQFEHQTRFSVMQQRRAEVIAECYKKLATAQLTISQMVAPMQLADADTQAQRKEAAASFNGLVEYFSCHRLFLGADAGERCERLVKMLKQSFVDFEISKGPTGQHMKGFEAWTRVMEEFPPALAELEKSFHKILGITDCPPQATSI